MKRVIACILMLCMVLSLAGCGNSDGNKSDGNSSEKPSETPVTSDDPKALENIVEEIAVDYGTYGAEAEDRINTLLKNLADADKSAGTRWKEIMDIWQSD